MFKKLMSLVLACAIVFGSFVSTVSAASLVEDDLYLEELIEIEEEEIPGPTELFGYPASGYITSYHSKPGVYRDWVSVNDGGDLGSKLANLYAWTASGTGGYLGSWNWSYSGGSFNVW